MQVLKILFSGLIWIYFLSNPGFPQSSNRDLEAPINLTYSVENDNDVHLQWEAPSSGGNESYLHWGSGEYVDQFGFFTGAQHFAVAAKWNPEHIADYNGWTITKLKFYVTHASPVLKLKIWTGADGTEVYSQDITTFNVGDWTEITLDTPVTINAETDLWAGLDVDMPVGAGVMGTDGGPGIQGNGDMMQFQGAWYTGNEVGYDHNWNLQIYVQESKKSPEQLLGYNIYRENALINTVSDPNLTYVDEALEDGTYNYHITAIYDVDESDPSNSVSVFIGQSDLEAPTNLTYTIENDNDVHLLWNQPAGGGSDTYLHWDSGENADSWGFLLAAEHFATAARWNPEHLTDYDQWTLTKLKFYVTYPTATLKLKVWSGENATEIYSQDIDTYNTNEWTEITLDTPVTIDAGTDLWAGLDIDMPAGNAVMGIDAGPGVVGNGDMIMWQGGWYNGNDVGYSHNWNLQIYVQESKKSTEELLGYNVYRNDEMINSDPVAIVSYIDEAVTNGTYEYEVTAVYDQGESDASNIVEVTIDLPSVLNSDSLALVDLYNSCGGTAWNNQDLWLEGQVTDWAGVVVEGNRVTSLFLSNNNLNGTIPESFGNLDALTDFKATSNNITALPESFGNLINLETFWIGWNPLQGLPESFGNATALTEVHLGFSDLGSLPENFGNLENLEWLALGDAGLFSLPSTFGNLSSLSSCFIWGNNLTELPENFGDLESIFWLTLDQNQLSSLPESFGNMTTLSHLNLEENQLTSLPESFGGLVELDSLYLAQNQLTSLPESFGDLDDMSYVRLSINSLSQFPASFTNLATIQVIQADQNQITELPENIGNLGNTLLLLGLSGNQISEIPSSIGELDELYELYMSNNQLESLPEEIGDLETLQILALDNNSILELPASISNISNLGYLGIMDNELEMLPENFGDLPADTLLMTGNNLLKLPESMWDRSYDYLWVDMNNLQFGSLEALNGNVNYEFKYNDQDKFGNDTLVDVPQGSVFEYSFDVTGDFNTYQWYKDGTAIDDQTSNTIEIENIGADDLGIYTLRVNNTVISDLQIRSRDVEINLITGLNDRENLSISFYPNPVTSSYVELQLNSDFEQGVFELYTTSGQRVLHQTINQNTSQIEVGHLQKGMYLAVINNQEGQQKTKKLVIQ